MYFFKCHHCLNILIYTFKCTGKSWSICMTVRDDNDERLLSITIRSTFEKVSKRMPLYEYVYVGAVHKSFQYNFTFSMNGHTSRLAEYQFQPYYKLHSRFLHFRNFLLVISSIHGVMFNSFKTCLHFVGHWQTVQAQIRCHITTVALDQVMSSSKRLKWETLFDMYGLT